MLFGRARVTFVAQNEALEAFLRPGANPMQIFKKILAPRTALSRLFTVFRWCVLLAIIATACDTALFLVLLSISSLQTKENFVTAFLRKFKERPNLWLNRKGRPHIQLNSMSSLSCIGIGFGSLGWFCFQRNGSSSFPWVRVKRFWSSQQLLRIIGTVARLPAIWSPYTKTNGSIKGVCRWLVGASELHGKHVWKGCRKCQERVGVRVICTRNCKIYKLRLNVLVNLKPTAPHIYCFRYAAPLWTRSGPARSHKRRRTK